ncbi:endonuclease Q family protein [Parafilimonas sp.]|uniref:endonuclease Q family protein n=1 Tax=Parafilimonas sp. TaxID=1969739 RepID=UPI0039E477F3
MFYIADLHTHSHYAGATSKSLNLETLYQWALIKGIDVVSTGDFTHPAWLKELQEKLQPAGNGFYTLKRLPPLNVLPGIKASERTIYFCLSVEVSCEYMINNRKYRTHQLIYAKDFEAVHYINTALSKYGNLTLDGRPSLQLQSHELFKIVLDIPRAYFVPAHVWTPWCSSIGAMEGHDSLSDCFKDVATELFAIETSLSADPLMCRQYDELDGLTLLSNSDAHSPRNLGREVNLLKTELGYDAMFNAFKTKQGFAGTYELFPQKGKCYNTGHRDCGVSIDADKITGNICAVCGKPLTIGVSHRVQQLANCKAVKENIQPFKYVLPLPEIFAELLNIKSDTPLHTVSVAKAYTKAIAYFGNEFDILHKVALEDIQRYYPKLATAINRLRNNEKQAVAGYDGIYGRINFFNEYELNEKQKQLALFG